MNIQHKIPARVNKEDWKIACDMTEKNILWGPLDWEKYET